MQGLRIRDPGPVRGGGRQAISAEWANRMRDCVMAISRVIPTPNRVPSEWIGSDYPWKLSTRNNDGTLEWKVEREEGTITDGTNGSSIDITAATFDTWTSITATKYIALEASVSTALALSSWTLSAVDAADALEVGFDGTGEVQDTIRLIIGKVTITSGAISHEQIAKDHQRVDYGFLNGVLVKVFNLQAINPAAV